MDSPRFCLARLYLIAKKVSIYLFRPSLPTSVQEERVSTVQNGIHEHLLEDAETEAEVARVCAFRTDRQEESRSLDSMQDENRIPSRYSNPTDHPDPARATRIRDLVSMLHPPSRMVHS